MFSGRKDTVQLPSLMKRLIQGIKSGPSSPTTPTTPTMPPNVPCECSQHGWLTKDHTKRRWFALVGSDLFWFDKQECDVHSKRATHWLPLEGDAVCARYGRQGIIVRSDGRQMILGPAEGTGCAEKSESVVMNEWLAKLKAAAEAQRTAPGANDITRIRKTGMLTYKKTRHYFVLREKYMTWSKSEKVCFNRHKEMALLFSCSQTPFPLSRAKQSNKLLGKIQMSGAELERKTTTCFVLSRRDQSLELTTSSPRESDEWCAALQKAIDAQKHRAQCDAEALSKIAEVVSTPVDVTVNGQVFRGVGNTFESAQTIKERAVRMMVASASQEEQQRVNMLFDAFFLRVVSVNIFLVPEQVPLKQLPVFVLCSRTLSVPTLELVSKQKLREEGVDIRELADTRQTTLLISRSRSVEEKRETLMSQRYTTLLANQTASATPDPEFLPARQSLLKYVADVNDTISKGRSQNDRFPQFFGTEPMPREVPGCHPDDRLHDPVNKIRRKPTQADEIAADLILFK